MSVRYDRHDRHDLYMMDVAYRTAKLSRCSRKRVGCVLSATDYSTFVVGYNGGARGDLNGCARPEDDGNCGCLHAEINAIAKASWQAGPLLAFITRAPCEACAIALVNAGVVSVKYGSESSHGVRGLGVLRRVGVPSERL